MLTRPIVFAGSVRPLGRAAATFCAASVTVAVVFEFDATVPPAEGAVLPAVAAPVAWHPARTKEAAATAAAAQPSRDRAVLVTFMHAPLERAPSRGSEMTW